MSFDNRTTAEKLNDIIENGLNNPLEVFKMAKQSAVALFSDKSLGTDCARFSDGSIFEINPKTKEVSIWDR